MIPVIIDTDMALDDWMAILYLLKHPGVDVKAVAVSGTGEAHARPGAINALRLAALIGRTALKVGAGSEKPLRGDRAFPFPVRFIMDHHFFTPLPRVKALDILPSAVEVLTAELSEASQPVTILAVGPLTNLGAVLQARPELVEKIASIVIMGGALDIPGNIQDITPKSRNQHAEWNIYIDSHAANLVFRSGVPVVLVPLDATNQVPLTENFLKRLKEGSGNPAVGFIFRSLSRMYTLSRGRGFYFWDPLAAVLAVQPELGQYEHRRVRVVEEECDEYGRTLVVEDGPEIRVCVGVDCPRFEEHYLQTLCGPEC